MKIWILTSEYNDYDQHGEYFEGAFKEKPSVEQLAKFVKEAGFQYPSHDIMEALAFIEHLRKGGGRMGTEDVWYNLVQTELL